MEVTGLDLGSSSIKFVTIKKETKELLGYGVTIAPTASLESQSTSDIEEYAKFLREYLSSQKVPVNLVSVSLPETKVFNRIITVPKMSDKELKNAITFEAEQYLPLPLKDVVFDYSLLEVTSDKKQNVLLIAAPRELVLKYSQVINKAGLTLVGLEPETAAFARTLSTDSNLSIATLVVNLGASSTDLAIIYGGVVRFTRSIGTGGSALTRAISQNLGFEEAQAEEYKKTYGLDESQLEGKIARALKPVFEVIVEEIRRSLAYYQTHQSGSPTLRRLVLSGGTASLPGVLVYLANALNLEAQVANPWQVLKNNNSLSEKELEALGPIFSIAVGLAIKDF